MKYKLLACSVIAACLSIPAWADPEPSHERLGADKSVHDFADIDVKNLQDETLGRISEVGIDLINGRIVEALVKSDSSLGVGGKLVAVPPLALIPDPVDQVYRLNVSTDLFKSAAGIDLSKWSDSGRSDRVAAAYRLFGQVPYFLEEGADPGKTAGRRKVSLGYVERSSKILDMPVRNLQGEKFGNVWALSLDIPDGRIQNVIILAPGNFKTKSIVPAMALSFNGTRDGLVLDDTKMEFADEPRYVFTAAAYGQAAYSQEESYKGPHTSVALEQGQSYRDVDRTVRINRNIRDAKISAANVQVGTINGRVTLRGWVGTEDDKRRIGEIAIAASRLELVDNQISVGKPLSGG